MPPSRPAHVTTRSGTATTTTAAIVEARDAAILRFLERHDGVASHKDLIGALPTDDPAKTLDAKKEALKLALMRLRAKHLIDRTADTWSLVGAGLAEVAHA